MKTRLLIRIQAGELPHALLITGPDGSGKADFARRAASLYCLGTDDPSKLTSYPGYLELAGGAVTIDDVRALMAAAAVKPFNDTRRAFLLTDAHRLDMRTQNALLKVLEEPPADTMLFLTGVESGFLPTIRSRCMIERFGAEPVDAVANALHAEVTEPTRANVCAAAADGVIGLARYYASESGWAFRTAAVTLLTDALFAEAPFAAAAELLQEDVAKDGKRKRTDPEKLRRLLSVWEGLLRDALSTRYGGRILNIDAAGLTQRIAQRFTDGEIRGIIEKLGIARQRLGVRANASLTVDTLLAQMCLKETV